MADVPVPSIATATPADADSVLGVQGGVVKRFLIGALKSFTQAGTGAASRNLQDKARESLSVQDFGVVGDGVVDDTAAFTNAVAAANGRRLNGNGATIKLTAAITASAQNVIFENMTLDCSAMPNLTDSDNLFNFIGTQGDAVLLTANLTEGTAVVTVGSTAGFAAEQYVWLTCTTLFEAQSNAPISQMAKVKSVDSATQITLYTDAIYDFPTSASASIAPLTLKRNITFRNMRFIGSQANLQAMLVFNKCADVVVDNCHFQSFDYVAVQVNRSVNVTVVNCSFRNGRAAGYSCGVGIIHGCYNAKVASCYAEDLRHAVTVGGNTGINLFVEVTGNHFAYMRDAGIDAHPAADFMVINGNTVECNATAMGADARDGIIFQGANAVITNNIIVGARVKPIYYEGYAASDKKSVVIANNLISHTGPSVGSSYAISVVNQKGGTINGVVISGNMVKGANADGLAYVFANLGNIRKVSIAGNVAADKVAYYGIYLTAPAGYSIEDFSITGNVINSTLAGIACFGASAINIKYGVVCNNVLRGGGAYGTRYSFCQAIVESNTYSDATTNRHEIQTNCLDIKVDRNQSDILVRTQSATTLVDHDRYLVVNRAGAHTVALPSAAVHKGREITIKTLQAFAVTSLASDVVPIDGTVAGTAILPATAGAWALLKSDGTNWVIVARG